LILHCVFSPKTKPPLEGLHLAATEMTPQLSNASFEVFGVATSPVDYSEGENRRVAVNPSDGGESAPRIASFAMRKFVRNPS
jgi:hypothetical protein